MSVLLCHMGFLSPPASLLLLCARALSTCPQWLSHTASPPRRLTHAVRPSSISASTVEQTSVLPLIGMNCSVLFFPHSTWFLLLSCHLYYTTVGSVSLPHHSPFLFPPIYVCTYTHIFMYLHTHTLIYVYILWAKIYCVHCARHSVTQMHLMPPPWSWQSSEYLSPKHTVGSLGRRIVLLLMPITVCAVQWPHAPGLHRAKASGQR